MTDFELDRATRLEPAGDGAFSATIDDRWWGDRAPHGGFLTALLLRALREPVGDPARAARSIVVHFVAPVSEGPATIAPVVERSGRWLTSVSGRMTQNGATVAIALAAFGRSRESFDFADAEIPIVKAPEELKQRPTVGEGMPPFLGHLEIWPALGAFPFTGERAYSAGWIRLRDERALDELAVALIADAWIPAVWPRVTEVVGTPTVTFSVQFLRPLPLDRDREPFLIEVHAGEANGGFYVEDAEIWSRDGVMVARARQLAMLIPRR